MDNLFTSTDLLDHMGDRQLGVTGTMRLNRIHGIPLTSKKDCEKNFERGQAQAVYSQDSAVILWRDNKPVYMASNFDELEPFSACQRYSKADKGYIDIPQPSINAKYNENMGGVDLVDNSEKNYAITARCKKWYWSIYAWFLNIIMVQAWRLFRAHKRQQHKLVQEKEKEDDEVWERRMDRMEDSVYSKTEINSMRKVREKEKKQRRAEERKTGDIPLLEFTRQVVEVTFKKHAVPRDTPIISQRQASAQLGPVAFDLTTGGKLTATTLETVRYDSGRHLPMKTTIQGVCKECTNSKTVKQKRSFFRCTRCNVALHAECFLPFHVPENEREELLNS